MYIPPNRSSLNAKIQAPFILAAIRALRSSIFKKSPEVQTALTAAARVEQAYDLTRADLFLPLTETWGAIVEPFAKTVLTGTLREIGYEIFPQLVSILNIPPGNVKVALGISKPNDVIQFVSDAYRKCVIGSDAGALEPSTSGSTTTITDTTCIHCALQMGVFLGAGKMTGLFRYNVLTERRCRARGDTACSYDFAF
jgi:hypothetical protein